MKLHLKIYIEHVLALPRFAKRFLAVSLDTVICCVTAWLSLFLMHGEFSPTSSSWWQVSLLSLCVAIPIFIRFGLYRAIFRYSKSGAMAALLKATTLYTLVFSSLLGLIGLPNVSVSVGPIQAMLLFFGIAATRHSAHRILGGGIHKTHKLSLSPPKVLIYGAGWAGQQLVSSLQSSETADVVGYLDDDKMLQGQEVDGVPVFSPLSISTTVARLGITHILLALPSVSAGRRKEIVRSLVDVKAKIRTLPGISDLLEGKVRMSDLRDLNLEELVDRNLVEPDEQILVAKIAGKIAMITGAGGSIGSELCWQIFTRNIEQIIMVETSEHALYQLHNRLLSSAKALGGGEIPRLVPLLCSVQDKNRITEIINAWKPDIIFHAAAYKHVPIVETNICEGIKNNLFGTLVVAQAAIEGGVSDFVLISTDKAVRPTNVMGATKRLAEMVIQAMQEHHEGRTCFSIVRFGNVIDSSGSVIPKFRQQIQEGGPVTVTHPEVTRFFMSIPEAAQLVIQAWSLAKGGEVFILDMGKPIKILDLARRMISLSGLTVQSDDDPEGDIEIAITGLRSGEKLYEELLIGDNPMPTSHPRIMKANEQFVSWIDLQSVLKALDAAAQSNNMVLIRDIICDVVNGYQSTDDLVDLLHIKQEKLRKAQT